MKWSVKAKFLRSIGMPEWWISQKREEFMSAKSAPIPPQASVDVEALKRKIAAHLSTLENGYDWTDAVNFLASNGYLRGKGDEVERLRKVIAMAAYCILEGKTGIKDTIWLNDHVTLYEHLCAELSELDLTAEYHTDLEKLMGFVNRGEK